MWDSLTLSDQIQSSLHALTSLMKFTSWVPNPTCLLWVKHERFKANIFNIVCCHIDLRSFPHQTTLFSYQEASGGVALETESLTVLLCFFGDGQAKMIHVQKADCSFRGLRERGNEGIAVEEAWRGLWGFNEAIREIRNRRWETRRAQSAAVGDFRAFLWFVSVFLFLQLQLSNVHMEKNITGGPVHLWVSV